MPPAPDDRFEPPAACLVVTSAMTSSLEAADSDTRERSLLRYFDGA